MESKAVAPLDTSEASADLFAALAKAQADVESVGKDGKNTQRGYKYATTEAMIRGSRQHLAAHGLAFFSTWSQSLPEVMEGNIGDQFVAARVTIHWVLGHASGGQITGTAHMDAIGSKARPPDKAVAAALTYGLGFVLRGLLLLDRADEDEHSPDRRPEPEPEPPKAKVKPDPLWEAYKAQRAAVARVLRVPEPEAHQRLLADAGVVHGGDPTDIEAERMIAAAERLLAPPAEPRPEPTPEPAPKAKAPAKGKAKPEPEPAQDGATPSIVHTRNAFRSAYRAYQEECAAQGEKPMPWKQLASKAIGMAWSDLPGTDEYLKAADLCELEIERMRTGGGDA
jgi:hypothetical protein